MGLRGCIRKLDPERVGRANAKRIQKESSSLAEEINKEAEKEGTMVLMQEAVDGTGSIAK